MLQIQDHKKLWLITGMSTLYMLFFFLYPERESAGFWVVTGNYVAIFSYVILYDSIQESKAWRNLYNMGFVIVGIVVFFNFFPLFAISDVSLEMFKTIMVVFALYGIGMGYGSFIAMRFVDRVLKEVDIRKLQFSGDFMKVFEPLTKPVGEVVQLSVFVIRGTVSPVVSWISRTTSRVGLENMQYQKKVAQGQDIPIIAEDAHHELYTENKQLQKEIQDLRRKVDRVPELVTTKKAQEMPIFDEGIVFATPSEQFQDEGDEFVEVGRNQFTRKSFLNQK